MIALIQRVTEASVTVFGQVSGAIGPGLLIFLGVRKSDTKREAEWLAQKCAKLRIFPDERRRMNLSLQQTGGEALVVPQFTLNADTAKGNRPSFPHAAPPELAQQHYLHFIHHLSQLLERPVATGVFGAFMEVRLLNNGPVTVSIERRSNCVSV